MSLDRAKAWLSTYGLESNIKSFSSSSATVALAAAALGCEEARIAKTLSFSLNGGCILIVAAGDTKIDNSAFKAKFGAKAVMLAFEDVEPFTGHAVGGVCPFGVNIGVKVYLDESLKRFDSVYPACGEANNAVELTIDELCTTCPGAEWVNVCKGWQS